MPSILGSAQLVFAKKAVSFTTTAESEVKVSVRERNIYRKLFLAVVPNGGVFTDYYWTGRVEFRLKGNPVETWRVGYAADGDTGPGTMRQTSTDVLVLPPYWIETFTAAGADWPVVALDGDEQVAIVQDINTATTKYHVHMKPVSFTGHFDEVAFVVSQSGTASSGERNAYLIVGCQSDPVGD